MIIDNFKELMGFQERELQNGAGLLCFALLFLLLWRLKDHSDSCVEHSLHVLQLVIHSSLHQIHEANMEKVIHEREMAFLCLPLVILSCTRCKQALQSAS